MDPVLALFILVPSALLGWKLWEWATHDARVEAQQFCTDCGCPMAVTEYRMYGTRRYNARTGAGSAEFRMGKSCTNPDVISGRALGHDFEYFGPTVRKAVDANGCVSTEPQPRRPNPTVLSS